MDSCAWINGQYQQVGPPSQPSQSATQLTHYMMRNPEAGTANNSRQYITSNKGVQPPQGAYFTFSDGAYCNRQTSNWQTSGVPHQAVSSQQPPGGKNYYVEVLDGNLQNSSTSSSNGNPVFLFNGYKVAAQQDIHSHYAQNSVNQSPPNIMKANTTYPQQYMSAHWNKQLGKQSIRTQNGNMSDLPHYKVQKSRFQNVTVEPTQPVRAYTTTATSLPHKQVVCTRTLESATTHNRQTAYNHNHRRNSTQHGFPMVVSQSFRDNSNATNSSSEQSQKTHQEPTQLNSTNNNTSYIHSNSYSRQCEISHTNELPLKPAADTQQEMIRRQIAVIADELHKSFTAGLPSACTSSPDRGKQFVSEVRMTESNQNIQPVTLSVTKSYNSNTFQSSPCNSGLSMPKMTHNVMSRTQHGIDAPPQQSSVPNVFSVTATEANAFFPQSNRVSKGNLIGSLSDASQLMKLPETQSPVANNCEILEMHSSLNQGSIHSSPGRTGMRAVAVVQPLSQQSYQVASRDTSFNTNIQTAECTAVNKSLSELEKLLFSPVVSESQKAPYLREGSIPYPETPNQMRSNNPVISHSAASNDVIFVSSSDSAEHQDLTEKQLCTDDSGCELVINMQGDQRDAPTAKQLVEVPVNQCEDKDKSESGTDPKTRVCNLSSVPTIPWTTATLIKLIEDAETAQMERRRNCTQNVSATLLNMFWGGSCKNLTLKLRTSWYKDLITEMKKFCIKHVTLDSVILSEVKSSFRQQLKSCVLKDKEVYSEPLYKSSWLNVNEQLDDIDKEFGFQWPLTHRLNTLESDSQPDRGRMVHSIPAQIVSEASDKISSQTELVVHSGEKQAFAVETTSIQNDSPNKTESADSIDPYYSFEIQVLPPEEARVIFEQVQSKVPQSMDGDSQTKRVVNSPVESELPKAIDGTLKNSKLDESHPVIKQVCCLNKLMETIFESNTGLLSECQCKKEQNHANENNQITAFSLSELCNKANQTTVLTEDDDKPQSYSYKEPTNLSYINIDSSQSSIILTSVNEDEALFSGENQIPKQILHCEKDSEQAQVNTERRSQSNSDNDERETNTSSCCATDIHMDCVQDQLNSTGNISCTSVSIDKEIESLSSSESEGASQMSDLDKDCREAQLTATDVAGSSLEAETGATAALQTTFSLSGKHETVGRKRKRLSRPDIFFPVQKKSSKCPVDVASQPIPESVSKSGNVSSNATNSNALSSSTRTVELVLFGSALRDKSASVGGRKRRIVSPEAGAVSRPPEVLFVTYSSLRRKSTETVSTGEYSVKQRIHKSWLQSLPQTKIRHSNKLKFPFAALSRSHLKKSESIGPTNTEVNICKRSRLKRRKSHTNGIRHKEEKTKKDAVTLKEPSDQERSDAENGRQAVRPHQKCNTLKFSVLPNTFRFKDGSSRRMETNYPVPKKHKLVEREDKNPNKTVMQKEGTWYPSANKNRPPPSPPVPKTSGLFHLFRKKYMEMTRMSTDE